LERLRKAMNKEKEKALKYISEKPVTTSAGGVHTGFGQGPKIVPSGAGSNLDSFAKNRGLIVGERVDHVAANQQLVRAEELRELVELSSEEFFNMFEMVPQTAQDVYFSKLTAGTVKTAIVSCSDDLVDRDVQTEDLGEESKFNQAPDDILVNYNKQKGGFQRKKKRENEALQLEKFMQRAGPLMEQVIELNE
jgi:hypothetical protein